MTAAKPLDPEECRKLVASERWKSKTAFDEGLGCEVWTGAKNKYGYGQVRLNGRMVYVNRVALVAKLGRDIAPKMDAGHTCHDLAANRGECDGGPDCPHRACLTSAHLEEQTASENTRATPHHIGAKNSAKELCPRCSGEYSFDKNGGRFCRACSNAANAERNTEIRQARQLLGMTQSTYVDQYGWSRRTASTVIELGDLYGHIGLPNPYALTEEEPSDER